MRTDKGRRVRRGLIALLSTPVWGFRSSINHWTGLMAIRGEQSRGWSFIKPCVIDATSDCLTSIRPRWGNGVGETYYDTRRNPFVCVAVFHTGVNAVSRSYFVFQAQGLVQVLCGEVVIVFVMMTSSIHHIFVERRRCEEGGRLIVKESRRIDAGLTKEMHRSLQSHE